MVIIKIKEVPNTKEGLRERVRKNWVINQSRLYNQDTLVAMYKGEIVQVYKIKGYEPSLEEEGRVQFDIEEIESDLKGRKVDYRTSNPCTITDSLTFK